MRGYNLPCVVLTLSVLLRFLTLIGGEALTAAKVLNHFGFCVETGVVDKRQGLVV
jgi:hypothetical protein